MITTICIHGLALAAAAVFYLTGFTAGALIAWGVFASKEEAKRREVKH